MSSKKGSSAQVDNGCLVALLPFLLILGVIGTILEYIWAILIAAVIVGAVIAILVAVANASNKKAAAAATHQKNLSTLEAPEVPPTGMYIPTSTDFTCKEEETINRGFRGFLQRKNDILTAHAHVDYLVGKAEALRALERLEEANRLEADIAEAKAAVKALEQAGDIVFDVRLRSGRYLPTELTDSFSAVAEKLPHQTVPHFDKFFRCNPSGAVKIAVSKYLVFTPFYVLVYGGTDQTIRLIPYRDVRVSSRITTEMVKGRKESTDEVESTRYLHQTKSGNPDLRYKSNPLLYFVYRGEITLTCGSESYSLTFKNKSLTMEYEQKISDYLKAVNVTYGAEVDRILNQDDGTDSALTKNMR